MDSIADVLTREHRRCDSLFAQAESDAADGDLGVAGQAFGEFERSMNRHFDFEEQVLFPAIETAMGPGMGPVQVMRLEHNQMRTLFRDMAQALAAGDRQRYLGLSETLLVLMQQHNMKEEHILYRFAGEVLGGREQELLARLGTP